MSVNFRSNAEIVPKVGQETAAGFFQPGQDLSSSYANKRAPMLSAAVARILPSSIMLTLVVPPPTSMFSMVRPFFAAFENRSGAVSSHNSL